MKQEFHLVVKENTAVFDQSYPAMEIMNLLVAYKIDCQVVKVTEFKPLFHELMVQAQPNHLNINKLLIVVSVWSKNLKTIYFVGENVSHREQAFSQPELDW